MRRVRHLLALNYLNRLGGFSNQISTMSGQYNMTLEKVGGKQAVEIETNVFAKFNSQTMRGMQVICFLQRGRKKVSSIVQSLKLYRISDGNWNETLVGTFVPAETSPNVFTLNIFAALGSNELSGAETYCVDVIFQRRETDYFKRVYFNHLGCFDSILRLRQQNELLSIFKLDL
jgi:hypothetical protein